MATVDLGILVTVINHATAGLRSLAGDVEHVGRNAQATANRLKAIQVVIAGILLEKGLEFGKKFVEAASAVQNLDTRMVAWTGSVRAAQDVVHKMRSELGASGISMDTLGNSFIKLKASGLDDENAFAGLKALVSGLSVVGGGDIGSKLDGISTRFQQFLSKGFASSRELNSILSETGLTMHELAEAGGMSVTQFYEKLNDRLMGAKELFNDFNKAATKKFGDITKLLSEGTISGAMSKFRSDMDEAFGELGKRTGLNETLIGVFQNLSKAVTGFINSISKDEVDHFFKIISDLTPVGEAAASVIIAIAKGIVGLLDIGSQLLNLLPGGASGAAAQFGIIGYALFGPAGALIGASIGVIDIAVRRLMTLVSGHNFDRNTLQMLGDIVNGVTGGGKGVTGVSDEQLKKIKAAEAALAKIKVGGGGLGDNPDNVQLENTIKKLRVQIDNIISKTVGQVALEEFQTAGDEINAKIQGITDKTQAWQSALAAAKIDVDTSKMAHSEIAKYDVQIEALQKRITDATTAEVAQQRQLNKYKIEEFQIEQQLVRMQLQETERQLTLSAKRQGSPLFSAISGTAGGQLADQVAQKTSELRQTIMKYQSELSKTNADILQNASSPEKLGELRATADEYQRIIDLSQQSLSSLSAETELQTQFWGDLGNTIANDVGDAISGLIAGTETWADVGRKVFGDLINMAIKYIEQLIEIQLFQSSFGGAQGGLSIMSLLPLAKGGAFSGGIRPLSGQVTPFANGGIVNGPTLFGLAGEAGSEAIMPLTRIGGKLGVRAEGGGGNHYHVTVQAIDTQSGLQFIGQHIQAIDAGLNHTRNLNGRAGRF